MVVCCSTWELNSPCNSLWRYEYWMIGHIKSWHWIIDVFQMGIHGQSSDRLWMWVRHSDILQISGSPWHQSLQARSKRSSRKWLHRLPWCSRERTSVPIWGRFASDVSSYQQRWKSKLGRMLFSWIYFPPFDYFVARLALVLLKVEFQTNLACHTFKSLPGAATSFYKREVLFEKSENITFLVPQMHCTCHLRLSGWARFPSLTAQKAKAQTLEVL